jgi:hypothetical protein
MICSGLAMWPGLPPGWSLRPPQSLDTVKPVRPALGSEPRPVAPSSRISPPAPVEAPGKGEMAVGWLCVSTFISTCCRTLSF